MNLFWKLDEAIKHSESQPDLAVFSKEIGLGGQRHFLVSTRAEFWTIYNKLHTKKHYEVILPEKPCKLYLDLEYGIHLNRSKEGMKMIEVLIDLVSKCLLQEFEIILDLDDLILLDSSNEAKFSKHMIIR